MQTVLLISWQHHLPNTLFLKDVIVLELGFEPGISVTENVEFVQLNNILTVVLQKHINVVQEGSKKYHPMHLLFVSFAVFIFKAIKYVVLRDLNMSEVITGDTRNI